MIIIMINSPIPTKLDWNCIIGCHQCAIPVKNIGSAIIIPIMASPVISPDANKTPFSLVFVR